GPLDESDGAAGQSARDAGDGQSTCDLAVTVSGDSRFCSCCCCCCCCRISICCSCCCCCDCIGSVGIICEEAQPRSLVDGGRLTAADDAVETCCGSLCRAG